MAIVKILANSKDHPSVEKNYQELHEDFPTMSLATAYKTVSLVKDLGEELELGFSDGSNHYDGDKTYPHPHIICVRCKNKIDPDLASHERFSIFSTTARKRGYFPTLPKRCRACCLRLSSASRIISKKCIRITLQVCGRA